MPKKTKVSIEVLRLATEAAQKRPVNRIFPKLSGHGMIVLRGNNPMLSI